MREIEKMGTITMWINRGIYIGYTPVYPTDRIQSHNYEINSILKELFIGYHNTLNTI